MNYIIIRKIMTVEIDTNDRYYENNHDCPAEIK